MEILDSGRKILFLSLGGNEVSKSEGLKGEAAESSLVAQWLGIVCGFWVVSSFHINCPVCIYWVTHCIIALFAFNAWSVCNNISAFIPDTCLLHTDIYLICAFCLLLFGFASGFATVKESVLVSLIFLYFLNLISLIFALNYFLFSACSRFILLQLRIWYLCFNKHLIW